VIRNDAQDFAQRLYARVPANYRVYDKEQGLPLLALLQVIGEQIANLRQDLDSLWDNFFIETCQDWVVPYIGALVCANLPANPVGRSDRLEVRDTVRWRRSKGTPAMLQALAQETSGWPCEFAEFFRGLGWSQNVNHVRLERRLTVDVRRVSQLSALGMKGDPFAHAADFKPSHDLDEARIVGHALGLGRAAWGTAGRYQIKNLGLFVRRLQTFAVTQATPAAADPGASIPANAAYFAFDPLNRELPLFVHATGVPLTRAVFNEAPWQFLGTDVAVRQFGVPLAGRARSAPDLSPSSIPFTFGGATGPIALDINHGLRLIEGSELGSGPVHFMIEALWRRGASDTSLGVLSTLFAARGDPTAFRVGASAIGAGRLVIALQTGRSALGLTMPSSPAARFPGAVISVRAARTGALRMADAGYIYLPPAFLRPSGRLLYYIADDGSTYRAADLDSASLARASQGRVYPALLPSQSATPTNAFQFIGRMAGAMRVADPSRLRGAAVFIQTELFCQGAEIGGQRFQPQGALATITQSNASTTYLDLNVPNNWPAFTFAAARAAQSGELPDAGLLAVLLRPLSGNFIPSCELIIRNRSGHSLLVYLPEIANCPPKGLRLFVADDGSTWYSPAADQFENPLDQPARPATGQVLPITGVWPLQYRRPIALDLCRSERRTLLRPGEFGIDPELGKFAFAPDDPAIGQGSLSVDYIEAFAERVGSLTYDRLLDPDQRATRFVSQSGDVDSALAANVAGAPVHTSVAAALAAAADGDIIEITDSATYSSVQPATLANAAVRNLTIRAAAGQRPCLTFFTAPGVPTHASFRAAAVSGSMAIDSFELNGLLIAGGPLIIERPIARLRLQACTLDPRTGNSLLAFDANSNTRADYLLCRCIAGGLRLGAGVARLTVVDSLIDQQQGLAITGVTGSPTGSPPSSPPGSLAQAAISVQLERVTVLGRIHCNVLSASESILDDVALVEDRQSGCVRFSRYETGSVLPRRYQCVPTEDQATNSTSSGRLLAPIFNSRRFGRPVYGQLAATCPRELLSASEQGSEIGAFCSALNPIRLNNLRIKFQEFMPTGLVPVIIAET
jgi:hypothetical protein